MLSILQVCQLAVAAAEDREASYERPSSKAEGFGRYTRWYSESVERVLAHERIAATPEEERLIYILAACGEACDVALDYVSANS